MFYNVGVIKRKKKEKNVGEKAVKSHGPSESVETGSCGKPWPLLHCGEQK